ncbi:MAG: hypothetical protein J6M46_08665 [Lachnospiraceae bacterium]|nr:hypothetical protein [Lachnospiraceae bacterium]
MKAFHAFFVTFVLVIVLGFGFLLLRSSKISDLGKDLTGKAKQKTVEYTAKQLEPMLEKEISAQLQANGLTEEQAQQVLDSIPEEDKQKVTEIVVNHMEALPDAASYVQSGDTEGLANLLQENLTEEETQEINSMMMQYMNVVPDALPAQP